MTHGLFAAATAACMTSAGISTAIGQVVECPADSAVNTIVFTVAGVDPGMYVTPFEAHITRPYVLTTVATPVPNQFQWRLALVRPSGVADIDFFLRKKGHVVERTGGPFVVSQQGECVAIMSFQMDETWRLSVASRPSRLSMMAAVVTADPLREFEGTTEFRSPIARRGQEIRFRFNNGFAGEFYITMRISDFEARKEIHLRKPDLQTRLCEQAKDMRQRCNDIFILATSKLIPAEELVLRWEEDP